MELYTMRDCEQCDTRTLHVRGNCVEHNRTTSRRGYTERKLENVTRQLELLVQEAWQDGYNQAREDLNLEL